MARCGASGDAIHNPLVRWVTISANKINEQHAWMHFTSQYAALATKSCMRTTTQTANTIIIMLFLIEFLSCQECPPLSFVEIIRHRLAMTCYNILIVSLFSRAELQNHDPTSCIMNFIMQTSDSSRRVKCVAFVPPQDAQEFSILCSKSPLNLTRSQAQRTDSSNNFCLRWRHSRTGSTRETPGLPFQSSAPRTNRP